MTSRSSAVAVVAFVAATQARFPGYVFSLGSAVDGHHAQARFNWHATAPGDREPAYVGFDVIATEGQRVRRCTASWTGRRTTDQTIIVAPARRSRAGATA